MLDCFMLHEVWELIGFRAEAPCTYICVYMSTRRNRDVGRRARRGHPNPCDLPNRDSSRKGIGIGIQDRDEKKG